MNANREDLELFINDFIEESDRASVIVGCARIDELLHKIISNYILPSPQSEDRFLSGGGALSSYESRYEFCYRLGIINKDFYSHLKILGRMRNSFAHKSVGCSFIDGPESQRLEEFISPYKGRLYTEHWINRYFNGDKSLGHYFRVVLAIHLHRLFTVSECINKIQPESTWAPLIPNWESLTERGII